MNGASASRSDWLDRAPERWGLLNVLMVTAILLLLEPGSGLGRVLAYGAVLAVLAGRLRPVWTARATPRVIIRRVAPGLGPVVLCAATAVFAREFADPATAALASILFGFQLAYFRLFPEGGR